MEPLLGNPPLIPELHEDNILHTSVGVLKYTHEDLGYKLIVSVDKEISRYYRSLIPKWMDARPQAYPPHITVVRSYKEIPVNLEHWDKYQDKSIEFKYGGHVYSGEVYFWLNVYCKRLEDIRLELGLPVVSQFTLPPEGFRKAFHLTLANNK